MHHFFKRYIAPESDPFGGRFFAGGSCSKRVAPPRPSPCVAKNTWCSRPSPFVVGRVPCSRGHLLSWWGSSCYFVISCTARGNIDEIVCPCAAFSGLGKSMPFLTWSFETAAVGTAACPCYLVKTAKTRVQTNEIVWMRGRRRAKCCVRGLVVDGASADACLHAKE